ncbi:uncharacterized protein IUM83_19134 [Phytophthora cinnamomi]|uniref:uncharacterized protein n=1 Tax=Phytophthora cinnamomi TaxID=4785 RepID=UPI0035595F36|nr:hypothetical protein IUM83_19134 [Phytophthora cinnamomi]
MVRESNLGESKEEADTRSNRCLAIRKDGRGSPPPPLEVARATFFRLGSHAQLFQPSTRGATRTKGLKILRCFPHCCPEHIDRSYCGTSLSVRVELATRTFARRAVVVAVFASRPRAT